MPAKPEIAEIDSSMSGEPVEIDGEVVSVEKIDENIFMTLKDEDKITVAAFDSGKSVEEGEKVSVTGTVRIFRGEVEVVADSIRRS